MTRQTFTKTSRNNGDILFRATKIKSRWVVEYKPASWGDKAAYRAIRGNFATVEAAVEKVRNELSLI